MLKWYGDEVFRRVQMQAAEALLGAAGVLLEKANQTVPKDVGDLRDSGDVSSSTVPEPVGSVYYDKPYARRLHEHPEYDFLEKPQRGGKWLENATNDFASEMSQVVADLIKEAFE